MVLSSIQYFLSHSTYPINCQFHLFHFCNISCTQFLFCTPSYCFISGSPHFIWSFSPHQSLFTTVAKVTFLKVRSDRVTPSQHSSVSLFFTLHLPSPHLALVHSLSLRCSFDIAFCIKLFLIPSDTSVLPSSHNYFALRFFALICACSLRIYSAYTRMCHCLTS